MAKFCTNCGSQLNDGDKVCGQCGTPVAGAAKAAASAGAKDGNKIVKIIAAVIGLIVLVVIVANAAGSPGYKKTLDKMFKAIQKDDAATLESLASSISEEIYGARYGDNLYKQYDRLVSNTLDKYEDNVGAVKKMSYEITDETEFSDRRLNDLKDNLVDVYHMDTSGIKKVVKVELQVTVKGAKKSAVYNVYNLYVVKEKGGWKIFYGDLNY